MRSAIFSVSVPATIIRSDCRGDDRGAVPKRSTSARGPCVCIISMAQQARPKSIHQTDDFRVQFRNSSALVVITISGMELMNDIVEALSAASGYAASRIRSRPASLRSAAGTFFSQSRSPLTHT